MTTEFTAYRREVARLTQELDDANEATAAAEQGIVNATGHHADERQQWESKFEELEKEVRDCHIRRLLTDYTTVSHVARA